MNVHIRLSYISKILICMKSIDEKKIHLVPVVFQFNCVRIGQEHFHWEFKE